MTSRGASNRWKASSAELFEAGPLLENKTVDLVIIGGGFTGTSAALEATRLGATVCLLEGKEIGFGGSGRNVGLVNAGLWLPPDSVIEAMGEVAGRRLIDKLGKAPDRVFDLIDRQSISCEATRSGTLHLAHSANGLGDLAERHRQGNRFGAPLQLLDAEETARRTGTSIYYGSLWDPRAGTVQPFAYNNGLARAASEGGAKICGKSPVTDISRNGDVWVVEANGYQVKAKALLLATNAYHLGIETPFKPQFVPVSFSQFATAAMPDEARERILAGGEGCWDTALIMSSFRVDQAGRLIFGGMGDVEGAGAPVIDRWARRKLRGLFPDLVNLPIEHRWSGRIAMTSDHIPKIVEFGQDAFACFGYSGRGIGPGTVFGTDCAAALLKGERADLPVVPIAHHSERFVKAKTAFYELGAVATRVLW